MKIIDPHLHLFDLKLGNYHWLKVENPPFWPDKQRINKSYNETHIALATPLHLSGFIHIEAGFDNQQPWRELATLEHACKTPFRAIANIDITASNQHISNTLQKLTEYSSFVGVRHLLGDQALTLLRNKQVIDNIAMLNRKGLVFEIQLPLSEQAPVDALCDLISNNKNISFIINHAGFPPYEINTTEWKHWHNNLTKLSSFPHVAIKCSGWEMIERDYETSWINKNLSLIFSIFGSKKVMLASNFPLCLFSHSDYQTYWQSILLSDFFQSLTEQEKSALCFNNALNWYDMADIIS